MSKRFLDCLDYAAAGCFVGLVFTGLAATVALANVYQGARSLVEFLCPEEESKE